MKTWIVASLLLLITLGWHSVGSAEMHRQAERKLRDLPLSEVPASAGTDALALFITGDGGWAPLDKNVSAELARRGVPVVGLSSLQYFWQVRTPDATASDVATVLRHYLDAWHREKIVLIGYSFGADVMPFVVNRLPPDLRARVLSVNLLGLSSDAEFEVTAGQVLHPGLVASLQVAPELARMRHMRALCVYGHGETDSLCPSLAQTSVTAVRVGEGHHLGNEYATLAQKIADFAFGTASSKFSVAPGSFRVQPSTGDFAPMKARLIELHHDNTQR